MIVHPVRRLLGSILVPGDKSISHRAVMLGSLAHGVTTVSHFLDSADCISTRRIFESLGARISGRGDRLVIRGCGLNGLRPSSSTLDAGNSGTTARILLGLLAAQPFSSRLTGDRYLRKRPMRRVVDPLMRMGAQIMGKNDSERLPLTVHPSSLRGIRHRSAVASAQVKSALLMAGLYAEGETSLEEPTVSRDHTERMFRLFGIPLRRKGTRVVLRGPVEPFRGRALRVPGDISSASFFLVAALIVPGSRVRLKNVGVNPTRTGLLQVLRKMGGRIRVIARKVPVGAEPVADLIVEHSQLKGVTVGGDLVPRMIDEFPVLAVAACCAEGITVVKDAAELRVKESDRIESISVNLRRMGAEITPTKDGWIVRGPCRLRGGIYDSFGDHRIAMSLAVAGLVADAPVTILDTQNIATSYPGFETSLKSLIR
jgi:3-phosphoshikimate 1-carboxyvinyltransferase